MSTKDLFDGINLLTKIAAGEKGRQQALELAKLKQTVMPSTILTKEERLAGGHKSNIYDFNSAELEGLIVHLNQRLATQRVVLKQKITDRLIKAGRDPKLLKPYLDAVAAAANNKDKSALLRSVKELHQKIKEYNNIQEASIGYVANIRASKFFYTFRDNLKNIVKPLLDKATLSIADIDRVQKVIGDGRKLANYYNELEIRTLNDSIIKTNYQKIAEIIHIIEEKLVSFLDKANDLGI